MGSCLQLSIFSGSSCFCWLCPSCCLPLWVPMPKATVMYQLNPTDTSMDTATTATLCLMVTSQDTVTMAMQHPMDMSPEPDTDTTATLCLGYEPRYGHNGYAASYGYEPRTRYGYNGYPVSYGYEPRYGYNGYAASYGYEPRNRYGYNGYSSYGYQPRYGYNGYSSYEPRYDDTFSDV